MNDQGLLERVRGGFIEMPGLSLTPEQAARLWGVDPQACGHVIAALLARPFPRRTSQGRLVRAK
ncbi:hypothetical protein BH18ACI5_BH18ACI5_24300 [soil metagenome]